MAFLLPLLGLEGLGAIEGGGLLAAEAGGSEGFFGSTLGRFLPNFISASGDSSSSSSSSPPSFMTSHFTTIALVGVGGVALLIVLRR